MPIANRCVIPVCVSQVKVPNSVENEFEYIVNSTLSNFIKQLACLTIYAKDIFDELTVSLTNMYDRSFNLENKIDRINSKIKTCEVSGFLPLTRQQTAVYKNCINRDDDLFVHTEMPDCIKEMFDKAYPPPELNQFDEFRQDGSESMKFYTDPEFFLREWLKNVRVEKRKKKEKKKRRSNLPHKESANLPPLPPPSAVDIAVQEPRNDEFVINYNYGDVAVYEDPRLYNENKVAHNSSEGCEKNIITQDGSDLTLAPLPPPSPLPPPPPPLPPPPEDTVNFSSIDTHMPTRSGLTPDPLQSLLLDIQRGAVLKPIGVKQLEKRKTRDFRAMIAELRPAWDNNSDSEESDND